MKTSPFLSLIIPAWNEEQRLPDTLEKINSFFSAQPYSFDIHIVENGSTDGTAEVAARYARDHSFLHLHREPEPGKGNAVRTGMLAAQGQYRFMADVDLSMPIDQVPRFFPPMLEDFDIAIGSREAPGAIRYDEPEYRHFGGRLINTLIRTFALPGLHDTQCGFKCFRAEAAEYLFSRQTQKGWSFDIEILYIAKLRGYRVAEIPIPWYYRSGSKIRPLQDAARMVMDIFRIRRNHREGLYNHAG